MALLILPVRPVIPKQDEVTQDENHLSPANLPPGNTSNERERWANDLGSEQQTYSCSVVSLIDLKLAFTC